MFSESLIKIIFSASNTQRWNDHVRPIELTEIDKQSHKMIIAYTIAKYEEEEGNIINWKGLIEGSIFELLQRVVLTDLRPNIYYKIMEDKREEINAWVNSELDWHIKGVSGDFKDKFIKYFNDESYMQNEKRILKAAHFLATHYEFQIIYDLNKFKYGIEKTKNEIEEKKLKYSKMIKSKEFFKGESLDNFLNLAGQLRFQQRWAQSPRIPKTSVLGHMYFVSIMSYFASVEIGACDKRIYNNFFVSLFHDLPEILTRDIISPIKTSIEGLDELIKEYEMKQMDEIIFPLLPDFIKKEMKYFTKDEFENKIFINGKIDMSITSEDIQNLYNSSLFLPVDGKLLKVFDHLAAFIEAKMSINYGIRSEQLESGIIKLEKKYRKSELLGIDIGRIFDYFN